MKHLQDYITYYIFHLIYSTGKLFCLICSPINLKAWPKNFKTSYFVIFLAFSDIAYTSSLYLGKYCLLMQFFHLLKTNSIGLNSGAFKAESRIFNL